MKKIKLTKGKYALVDNEDFDYLNQFKWYYLPPKHYTSYAMRRNAGKTVYMHREIQKPPKGLFVDHINGDGLDNRRSNLRIATQAQNQANQRIKKVGTSGVVGVYFEKKSYQNPWVAMFSKNNKWTYIGRFPTKEEAIEARTNTVMRERKEFNNFSTLIEQK